MNRQELIEYCLTFPAAYEDYPFEELGTGNRWTAMRHLGNKKTFAFINVHNDRLCINLKCDPFEADILRQVYTDVTPGFHMNKTHWNTVYLDGDVPEDELKYMIEQSYNLIRPKTKR